MFFEDLTPRRKLTWIGALPDALKKAKNKDEAREILGADVTEESFNNFPGCQASAANARCYTTVSLFLFLSDDYLLFLSSLTSREVSLLTPVTGT